jgi:hypothetical protein
MSDGARNALGGYLYQIVAGAGLAARAVEVSDDERGELLYALIIEARNARVLHEMHGEDLVLRREDAADNSGTAVQFKFSRHGAAEAITPSDVREILQAFHRCATAASAEFPVTGYVLVTNRDLNDKIREHHGRRATPFDDLKRADRDWPNVPDGQKKEIEGAFGSVEAAARAWYAVFQNLSVYPRVGADHWLRALREYATARGLYDDEFEPALSRLAGDALRTTLQGPAEFSRGWLNRCLIGFPDARSLRVSAPDGDSARRAASEAVRRWLAASLGTPEQALVRRDHLKALAEKLAQHPIVLVLGWGGCGKSVLAAHYLLESAPSRFVAAVSARDLRAHWLGQEFDAWRGTVSGRHRPPHPADDVPGRLRHANPREPRPILLIDIDGLDEQGDRSREDVRALLTLCRGLGDGGVSDMALILTSRSTAPSADRARRNLIADLLSADYPGDVEGLFGVVLIDDFTEPEFAAAVLRHADAAVRGRLQAAAGTMSDAPPDTTLAESAVPPDAAPVPPEIVASLRHPVLWGVFSRLSVEDQHRVLDGAAPGLDRLAELFVERFCLKANRRRPTLQGERVRRALVRIARSFPVQQPLARRQANWVTHAARLVTQDEAAFLFDEAVSYGMIREEELGQWAWRHPFLRASLTRQEE